MIAYFRVFHDTARVNGKAVFRYQTQNDIVNFEGNAMAMHLPVRTRVTQEPGALFVGQRLPNILRYGTKRVDYGSPVHAFGGCRSHLIADQVE